MEQYKVSPILVHCSAGIGRTGTICALFNMIEALRYSKLHKEELIAHLSTNQYFQENFADIINHPMRFSVFGTVRKLRE